MTEESGNSKYADIESMSFRQGMAELDQIVRVLESDQVELEQGIESYERGVALLSALQKRLDSAEQKVTSLMGELEPEGDDIDSRLS